MSLVRTDKFIYVMEFKYNGSAQEAMDQIESKDYPLPFAMGPRTIVKVGVNFSGKTRNIDNWIIKFVPTSVNSSSGHSPKPH